MVRRYLASFGPAGAADAQKWCGVTRLKDAFERLRPELITFRDGAGIGTLLVDGFVRATWTIERARDRALLTIEPIAPIPKRAAASVRAEGRRLLAFVAPEASRRDVVLA